MQQFYETRINQFLKQEEDAIYKEYQHQAYVQKIKQQNKYDFIP